MGGLEGTIALITGGNGGIDLATAKQFVNEGAYVFVTGRRDPELAAAIKEIERNVTGIQGDVSNFGDLDHLFAQIKREKGKLDIAAGSVRPMRSRRPWCFSHPTTVASSPERNCLWMAAWRKCRPPMAKGRGINRRAGVAG